MRKIARYSIVVLVLSTFVWLTACESTLSSTEKVAVLAFSEAATDNLFAGLTANDYEVFSREFDSDMCDELPVTDFAAWKQELDNKIRNYLSRNVDQVTQVDEFFRRVLPG